MATAKRIVKVADKLTKVSDNVTIYRYDNGFCLEISGNDANEDWANAKIIATSFEDLCVLLKEALTIDLV